MTVTDILPGSPLTLELVQYRIVLPAGLTLINANVGMHHRRKAPLVKEIRDAALVMTRHAKVPRMERAHAFYIVHPDTVGRRRDPGNWAPSAKAAIDGMVDAGALDDDNSSRLLGPDPRLGAPVKGSQLVLVITDLSALPGGFLELFDPTRQLAARGGA